MALPNAVEKGQDRGLGGQRAEGPGPGPGSGKWESHSEGNKANGIAMLIEKSGTLTPGLTWGIWKLLPF